jgi:hypothetical protein
MEYDGYSAGTMAKFCEHSNELLGSMKTVNFFVSSVTTLFKKDPSP